MASSSTNGDGKPAVLIIGGLGYVGRFLALHIHENNLASEVRLVDKVLPQLAWLAPEFKEACSQDKFMQADASRENSLSKIFTPVHASSYTYVFNCGGETRYSQEDSVYKLRSTNLTTALAHECARRRIPALIEFSSGTVYKPPSASTMAAGGCAESAPLKPWLNIAKHKVIAEERLAEIQATTKPEDGELRYAILRLAHVYGEYESGVIARILCVARIFQALNQELKFLYGKDLHVNTVHVLDVCTAAWAAAEWCASSKAPRPPTPPASTPPAFAPDLSRIFNIVDEGDTTQGDIATLVSRAFNIPVSFTNTLVSTFARFNLGSVVDEINEEVLQPWADLLSEKNITRPGPISPFMEKELLKDADMCLDGRKAREVLGWRCEEARRRLSKEALESIVESYRRMSWWP